MPHLNEPIAFQFEVYGDNASFQAFVAADHLVFLIIS